MKKEVEYKLLQAMELPEGAYTRYLRDIWYMSDRKMDFEVWKVKYEKEQKEKLAIRDEKYPVEHKYKFQLTEYEHVIIFKRKGEAWHCSECDMSPAGGCGNISLEEALSRVEKHCESQEVRNFLR